MASTKGINPDNWTPQPQPAGTCQLLGPFPGGGKWVCGDFLSAWNASGVGIYGYPISAELNYTTANGTVVRAQWFERARLERHSSGILGGLLGCEAGGYVGQGVPGCP